MKPINVADAYITMISHSLLLLLKIRNTRNLLKKIIEINRENQRVNNFCLKVLYFGFILCLHFSF